MCGRSGLASGKLDLAGFGSAPANGGRPRRSTEPRYSPSLVMMMTRQPAMADSNDPGRETECALVGGLGQRCTKRTGQQGPQVSS
jgi:hypothetical protein